MTSKEAFQQDVQVVEGIHAGCLGRAVARDGNDETVLVRMGPHSLKWMPAAHVKERPQAKETNDGDQAGQDRQPGRGA
jgi:hypothetical protein